MPLSSKGVIHISKDGKEFEKAVEQSAKEQGVFYFRVRDVMLPPDVRMRVKLPQNKYDCLLFYKNHLFPLELKSTKAKSISFDESMIKKNQIDNLIEANTYEGVIPGFLFNFRLDKPRTFFVHIDDFETIRNISQNGLPHTYKGRINKSSISLSICEEIGVELIGVKKVKKYRHYLNKLIDNLIEKYGE